MSKLQLQKTGALRMQETTGAEHEAIGATTPVQSATLLTQDTETFPVYEASGRHLLLTLRECAPDLLNDEQALRQLIVKAAEASGATVLSVSSNRFQPQGVTALALLAESHASLHTYPEANLVFWDCFTCGTVCDPELSIPVLAAALNAKVISHRVVSRS
jgi:S-adenosylmethionine decarboxylase